MYSRLQLLTKYFHYQLTASNSKGHGIHSPFIFDFITKILNNKKEYPAYSKVEALRQKLLNDDTVLVVEDFGAGSAVLKNTKRTVSSIAKNAAKPKKYGQLLYRIIKYYQPQTILELGTSLGITTSYLSLAKPDAKLISMEGADEILNLAILNFKLLDLHNIEIVRGNFDDTLNTTVRNLSSVDFAFIDGNHRKQPTENYFQELLLKTNEHSILIFDDIHWSGEMEAAWRTLKNHASVTCSIDLFFIGIIFFRKEFKEKLDFKIRF